MLPFYYNIKSNNKQFLPLEWYFHPERQWRGNYFRTGGARPSAPKSGTLKLDCFSL